MFSLDKLPIEFHCPKCGFLNELFFKQARLRDVIICRGCKSNIQLDDQMNECRKAEKRIRTAMREFEAMLGNIEIRIDL
jgi:hypothetical protein